MKEIERITRLHSAKTLSIECVGGGRASMSADEFIAVLAVIAHDHRFGVDAIQAKYLDDGHSAERCLAVLIEQAAESHCPRVDLAPFFAAQAIAAFCNKPLVSQRKSIKSLHKRHGAYANRSKQRVKKFNVSLRQARAKGNAQEVKRYEGLIAAERALLEKHAEKKASESDWCPRCAGTGSVALNPCPECAASGHVTISRERLRAYIRNSGVKISDKLFDAMWSYFESCRSKLQYESNDAARAMARRVDREKDHA